MSPRLEDPMMERPFDPNPWEARRGLDGMTVAPELEAALDDPREYQDMLRELAEFANGCDAEAFREYVRATVDNLRERRALEAHEARRVG